MKLATLGAPAACSAAALHDDGDDQKAAGSVGTGRYSRPPHTCNATLALMPEPYALVTAKTEELQPESGDGDREGEGVTERPLVGEGEKETDAELEGESDGDGDGGGVGDGVGDGEKLVLAGRELLTEALGWREADTLGDAVAVPETLAETEALTLVDGATLGEREMQMHER